MNIFAMLVKIFLKGFKRLLTVSRHVQNAGVIELQKMMSSFSTQITSSGEKTSHAPELEQVGIAVNDSSGKGGYVIARMDRVGPSEMETMMEEMKKSGRPNETVGILKQVPGTKKVEVN